MADSDRKRYFLKHIDFEGYWKIIWFGRITRLSEGADTVSIYTYLGKLSPADDLSFATPLEYKRILLPIGDLPVLYIGAVLKDGYLQFPEELPLRFNKTCDIELDITKSNIKAISRTEKDDIGNIVSTSREWPFYQEPQADAYVLGVMHEGHQFGVIIPCVEILRFFYCYASNIAKVITSHRILNPGRYLYVLNKSNYNAKNRIVTIKPRNVVSDTSAVFLACFISGYFSMERAQDIPKKIAASSQSEPDRHLIVFPPLDGLLLLKAAFLEHNNHLVSPQSELDFQAA